MNGGERNWFICEELDWSCASVVCLVLVVIPAGVDVFGGGLEFWANHRTLVSECGKGRRGRWSIEELSQPTRLSSHNMPAAELQGSL